MSAHPRARDLGIPFDGTTGPDNAITDVAGVCVGHENTDGLHDREINTGVTAILPRGNVTKDDGPGIDTMVFAGWSALNGNGEMTGTNIIEESGFLEGPIMLTNTISLGTVRNAVIDYSFHQLGKPSNPFKFQLNLPVVAETYDGWLNDILGFHVTKEMVAKALDGAKHGKHGDVKEGNVGGGTGMTCYSWKGGIGTSSRVASVLGGKKQDKSIDDYTVGVLVQANQGTYRNLVVRGVPVGKENEMVPPTSPDSPPAGQLRRSPKSSIIVVIATDAPLLPHQLKRLARRASLGIARTGTMTNNDSGEIFVAFSTANPDADGDDKVVKVHMLPNFDNMDSLFEATVDATEEAIINALVAAETRIGRAGNKAWGITDKLLPAQEPPVQTLVDTMKKYNRWKAPKK